MPPRIAVVGSLMMDLVVRAPRLPKAGESLLSHSFQTFTGGKGANQAIAAARLGAQVAMIGRIGTDRFGQLICNALDDAGIDTSNVSQDPSVGTGVAVPIVVDNGENAILAVPQANLTITPAEIEAARHVIESADALLLQFEVAMDANLAAARMAVAAGVPMFLNPAPIAAAPAELLTSASAIVANEVEAAALAPRAGADHLLELAELRRYAKTVVLTLGAQGSMGRNGIETVEAPPFLVAAVDAVGAGDAFCAAFAIATLERKPLAEALAFGNAAGALATTRPGAQTSLPTRLEVEGLLANG
jgi:ribokinase